jgi:hypothetical protein
MEPKTSGSGNVTADQTAADQPSTQTATGKQGINKGSTGTNQETTQFSPPGNQASYRPGGPNSSDGR